MKMIEWTRTGGRTHRVTITTDEPCSIMEYQMSRFSTILTRQDMDVTNAHDQRGVLWGIFGSWL